MLIMLAQNTARFREGVPSLDQFVVSSQECEVQLSDYSVLIVARITDIRSAVSCRICGARPAREIVEVVFAGRADEWWPRTACRAHRTYDHLVAVAKSGRIVHAVEIECRRAGIFKNVTNVIERERRKRWAGERG